MSHMAQPAPAPSLDTSLPFTTAQAHTAGITSAELRRKGFRRIYKGVYVAASTPMTPRVWAAAALATHGRTAFASHSSAAGVYGIPIPHDPHEHVSVPTAEDRRRRPGVECHVGSPTARVIRVKGVRVSAPTWTFIELAARLTLVDLVVAGDYIVRREWHTPEDLVAFCQASKDSHAAVALRAACCVRKDVDSPMETRLRMLLVLAGLPEPTVNFKVRDELGDVRRRFDLSYPDLRLIIEYDGRQHAEDPEQYDSDIYRREDLDQWGWRMVVVTSAGIYKEPSRTLERVRKALAERGARGLPSRLADAWRPYFPERQPVRRGS